ncbi:MAG: hypothetical protein H6636_13355 [Anaerolineales bacterium]|nr:hypothetical protein [Anaerolineales bacterium]
MWKALLLKESLTDLGILADLHITHTEVWQIENAAENQPSTWTALTFEADDAKADGLAEALCRVLHPRGWYLNGSTSEEVYVIFPHKVFKYRKGDEAEREAAKQFGRTIGIPERQLDWEE